MEHHWQSRAAHFIKERVSVEPWPKLSFQLPQQQSHRGYTQLGAQENTIPAFAAAKQRGAVMFECDVRLSRDQIPVLFHDVDLQRLAQTPDLVEDLTAAELFEKAQAPSLLDVLQSPLVPTYINIEIKSDQADHALERKVFEVLQKTKQTHRVMISSFNPISIWKFSQWTKDIPLALLIGQQTDRWLREMWVAPFLKFHMINMDEKLLTETEIRFWKSKQVPLAAWTVNDPDHAKELIRLGVGSIISDN